MLAEGLKEGGSEGREDGAKGGWGEDVVTWVEWRVWRCLTKRG